MARTRSVSRTPAHGYGFFPAPGTDYSTGQEPILARRLDRLAKALHLRLTGLSGARTPAHSVEVGGFADDPHTRGQASDTPGVESVPERTLRRFGLTRPFAGAREADHIQLLGGSRGSALRNPRTNSSTDPPNQRTPSLVDLWIQAGGAKNLAPIMAAIALAESGGRVDAVGGPNDNGTYDYGVFQINSAHSQFDANRLVSDPLYNARAAVAIERSQGLHAWSTYNSGAYESFMGNARDASPTFGRTRPGGEAPGSGGGGGGAGAETAFASYINEDVGLFGLPSLPSLPDFNPLDIFKKGADAVSDVASFLKWIAWIFHPRNILRCVEFLTGLTLMVLGIHTAIQVHRGSDATAGKAAKNVVAVTPVGRGMRVARGASAGRQAARSAKHRKEFEGAYKRGKSGVDKRKKAMDKKFGKDAPF